MADTINELYAKYADGVEQSLEDSKYFQYLFEMVQAGDNTLHQTRRVLHKVVDEEWLKVVEEGIDSIFNIVDSRDGLSRPLRKSFRWRWRGRLPQTVSDT